MQGVGSYGVDAAAKRYFDKHASEMTLSESAIIAGLLKAPSRFSPTNNPELSRKRATQVLVNMQDAGYLTEKQSLKAQKELETAMQKRTRNAQSAFYFSDWILDRLPEYIGQMDQDLVVTTTLRPRWQLFAEKAVSEIMDQHGEEHQAEQAALLSMTPDGAVRAMVGGRSYGKSQYNRATQAYRQPGSSFKLFVYLAGLENGLTPEATVLDEQVTVPIVGGSWTPRNYTGRYLGEITIREAVEQSINTVAVQVAMWAGLDHVIGVAHRLGIKSDLLAVPSIALGSTEVSLLEMTSAYAHLAADGARVTPYGITEIQTASGQQLYKRQGSLGGMALRPDIVGMMNDLLMGVVERGTGRGARIGRPAAGKTGTTSDYRDAWFMGYTPDLVTGVWVGNDNNTPMKKVTGGGLPAMIWRVYMVNALGGTPATGLPVRRDVNILPWLDPTPALRGRQDDADQSFWDRILGEQAQ